MLRPKRVVYVFGAGATQAEIIFGSKDAVLEDTALSMSTIRDKIFDDVTAGNIGSSKLRKFLIEYPSRDNIDIEQLITLLEFTGLEAFRTIANELRTLFRQHLQNHLSDFFRENEPKLAKALLQMHTITEVKRREDLTGIITTNYDDALDVAFNDIHGRANYGIRCETKIGKYCPTEEGIPLIKLHGAFNWKKDSVINLVDFCDKKNIDTKGSHFLWIPPGTFKQTDQYPFNIIWGKALETLNCDIIRVIGSSLSHNDWGLLSLIFRSQIINRGNSIEIIDYPDVGNKIKKDHPYFRDIKPIYELEECSELKDNPQEEEGSIGGFNPFSYWLYKRGIMLRGKGVDFSTYANFYNVYGRWDE